MKTDQLRHARQRAGLSIAQLAKAAGVTPKTVTRLERNDLRWVTLAQVLRVARAVRCTIQVEVVDAKRFRDAMQRHIRQEQGFGRGKIRS